MAFSNSVKNALLEAIAASVKYRFCQLNYTIFPEKLQGAQINIALKYPYKNQSKNAATVNTAHIMIVAQPTGLGVG